MRTHWWRSSFIRLDWVWPQVPTHLFCSRFCVLVVFFFFKKSCYFYVFLQAWGGKRAALQRSAAKDSPFVLISQLPFILNQRADKAANVSGMRPSSINLKKWDSQKQVLPELFLFQRPSKLPNGIAITPLQQKIHYTHPSLPRDESLRRFTGRFALLTIQF